MRKFRNKFAAIAAAAMTGVMAMGLVATATPVVSVYADEESEGDGTEEGGGSSTEEGKNEYSMDAFVDYDAMVLKVKTTDPYFTVDVLKNANDLEKPSKSYTYANIPATKPTVGEEDKPQTEADTKAEYVEIDLGFLKLKSANNLNIYGSSVTDKSKGIPVTVTAQPAKEKLTVDATKGSTLPEVLGKNGTEYEYHSVNGGTWETIDQFDFTAAQVAGTTLIVRKKAVSTKGDVEGVPAGPEIKVKIAAAAKAPKVTVDYVKDSVKLTDKMQVALLTGNTPIPEKKGEGGWVTASKAPTRSKLASDLGIAEEDASKPFTIVVRTEASGKKSASMPVVVQIEGTSELKKVDSEGKEVAEETPSANASVTIGDKATTISAKLGEKGVTFTITGEGKATFQYDKGNGKWANITDKAVKISDSTVKVRVAPDKSGAFASNSVELTPEVEVAEVTVALNPTSVEQGGTSKATATVKGADGKTIADAKITWSCAESEIKIAEDGTITVGATVKADEYDIKAECGGKSNTAKLTVTEKVGD